MHQNTDWIFIPLKLFSTKHSKLYQLFTREQKNHPEETALLKKLTRLKTEAANR